MNSKVALDEVPHTRANQRLAAQVLDCWVVAARAFSPNLDVMFSFDPIYPAHEQAFYTEPDVA